MRGNRKGKDAGKASVLERDPCGWAYAKGETEEGDEPEYVEVSEKTIGSARRADKLLRRLHKRCSEGGLKRRGERAAKNG